MPVQSLITSILIATFILILFYILHLLFRIYQHYKLVSHIPGTYQLLFTPFYIPLIAPYCNFTSADQVKALSHRFGGDGKIFRLSMCNQNMIWIMDRDLIKQVNITKASTFDKPNYVYQAFRVYGENVLSAENVEIWKKHHRAVSPAFSMRNLELVCQVSNDASDMLIERWTRQINASSSQQPTTMINIDDFSEVTMSVILIAGFGLTHIPTFVDSERKKHSLDSSEMSKGNEFVSQMDIVWKRALLLRRFVQQEEYPKLYNFLLKITKVGNALDYIGNMLDQMIDERIKEIKQSAVNNRGVNTNSLQLASSNGHVGDVEDEIDWDERKDLLSLLVKANLQDEILTRGELKSNALVFTLAGYDTSSTSLQWLIYELSKHPNIQHKCQQEIEQVLGGQNTSFTYHDFDKLEYVGSVVMECLRIHPPVFEVDKIVAKKNATIGEYNVPKGTQININLIDVNRDEKLWSNPQEFNPDRFATKDLKESVQNNYQWIPFSSGNRKCIGYKFAQIEITAVIVRLLQKCNFQLLNDERVDPIGIETSLTSKPTNLKVNVSLRN